MDNNFIQALIQALKGIFATKDDLKKFATKNDLKRFATKEDLVELKEELQQYIDDRLSHLPTKEEFFERVYMLIGQLRKTDKEQILQSGRLSEHDDILDNHEQRITRLERTSKTVTSPS